MHDGRIDDALARFDRYERRIDELEAEAESWALGRPRTLEDEFSELESEDAVNAELEDLKRRVAHRSSTPSQ